MESHVTEQQYASVAQMSVAQVSQPDFSFAPAEQTSCLHVPIPPPPPEELPPLLPPPPQVEPQIELTSPTQTESHFVLQQ